MLQQETPEDYVIATGETHSVREFVELAFKETGVEIEWRGDAVDEVGVDQSTGKTVVKIDPRYFCPAEVDPLLGNPEKAKRQLGWENRTSFHQLIQMMVKVDTQIALKERTLAEIGANP